VTNTGSDDLYILPWFTPLEGLLSDCLKVTRNGRKVKYDGPLVKRGKPEAEDYILLRANDTLRLRLPLDEAYHVSEPGTYKVAVTANIQDLIRVEPHALTDKILSSRRRVRSVALPGAATSFAVEAGSGKPRLTLGARARERESKRKEKASRKKASRKEFRTLAKPHEPKFTNGSADEQEKTKQAHLDAYALCTNALAALADDAAYKEWFGTHTTGRMATVKSTYSKIKKKMEDEEFEYDLTSCSKNIYAYTYANTTKIWVCKKYWAAPATGTDSKAGTLLHEHSHASAGREDVKDANGNTVYGQTACRKLAKDNPDDAIKNADNHEYYAGG
jgi:hypothetical protein